MRKEKCLVRDKKIKTSSKNLNNQTNNESFIRDCDI